MYQKRVDAYKLTCSMWFDLAFTILRYLIDFQETNKCNSCFVTSYQIFFKWNSAVWPTDNNW